MRHAGRCDQIDSPKENVMRRSLLLALALVCLTVPAHSVTVLAPGSTVAGATIGEWTQDWWAWFFSFPAASFPLGDDPLTDVTGGWQGIGQAPPVYFINAAASVPAGTTRTFTVPAGVHLLVALTNVVYVRSANEDPSTLPGIVSGIINQTQSLRFEINGVAPLTSQQLFTHREITGFFTMNVVANNATGEPAGTYTNNWGDGYWVMLTPLAPGETVTIRAGGTIPSFGLNLDIINVITAPPPDADADGVPDSADNCPYFANASQADTGGIGAGSPPDGIGDACQCGDVSGNGVVTTADATLITRSLLVPPTATLARPDLCNVGGTSGCTTSDAVIATRALLVPATASIQQVCDPAVP
jgi:hypothetical protein